jgi:hypothetical protein
MKYLALTIIFLCILSACNCHYEGNGYVLDKETGEPIANARIEVMSGVPGKDTLAPRVYTDSNGYFSYSHDHCKDMITIYKKDYVAFSRSAPDGDTIYLEVLIGN